MRRHTSYQSTHVEHSHGHEKQGWQMTKSSRLVFKIWPLRACFHPTSVMMAKTVQLGDLPSRVLNLFAELKHVQDHDGHPYQKEQHNSANNPLNKQYIFTLGNKIS